MIDKQTYLARIQTIQWYNKHGLDSNVKKMLNWEQDRMVYMQLLKMSWIIDKRVDSKLFGSL